MSTVATVPVLAVDGVRKSFAAGAPWRRRKVAVLRGASLEVRPEFGFGKYIGYRVEALSGGTRQKLNLALALLHQPGLLLLDEPYSGFDWETYLRFWEMAERRRADGLGILVVSHLLAERERLTRIYELRDGRCELL
jgi:ABC-2 type transport system ATP-binding protein